MERRVEIWKTPGKPFQFRRAFPSRRQQPFIGWPVTSVTVCMLFLAEQILHPNLQQVGFDRFCRFHQDHHLPSPDEHTRITTRTPLCCLCNEANSRNLCSCFRRCSGLDIGTLDFACISGCPENSVTNKATQNDRVGATFACQTVLFFPKPVGRSPCTPGQLHYTLRGAEPHILFSCVTRWGFDRANHFHNFALVPALSAKECRWAVQVEGCNPCRQFPRVPTCEKRFARVLVVRCGTQRVTMIESWQFEEVEAAQPASGSSPSKSAAYGSPDGPPQFDGVSTVVELWQKCARKNRMHPCMGVMMEKHKYSFMSYNEVNHLVRCLASSLRQVVTKGKSVGIWGENCPAWMLSFLACARSNLCSILLHDKLGDDSVETMIKNSGVAAVIISPDKLEKFAALMVKNPGIELDAVVYWGEELPFYSDVATKLRQRNVTMHNLGEFIEMGEEQNMRVDKSPTPDSIATVLYAAGPLGEMVGVTYTHRAIVSSIAAIDQHYKNKGYEFGTNDSILSYLPVTHIANITLDLWFLSIGAKVGYSRGKHSILDDAKVLQPTFFPGNANILREICNRISKTSGTSGGIRGALGRFVASWGYYRKLHFMKNGIPPRHASPLFDALVFRKSQKVLGGKQRVILVFGDPPSADVGEILRVCTSAAVHTSLHSMYTTCLTFSGPMNYNNVHTLGTPLPSVTLRLQSVPELGHDALGPVPEGELLIKSPHNFTGFHNNSKLVEQLVDKDGWLHTGEIARLEDDRFVFVGRKTSMYTATKEAILLEKVEQIYEASNLVKKIWVHPDSDGLGLTGTVVPNEKLLAQWAAFEDIGICGDQVEHLRGEQKIVDHVLHELTALGRKSDLRTCELLTKVILKTEEEVMLNSRSSSFLSLERGGRPDLELLTAKPRGLSLKALMSLDMDFGKLVETFKRSSKKDTPTPYKTVF